LIETIAIVNETFCDDSMLINGQKLSAVESSQ
jgi:hypothetical protein